MKYDPLSYADGYAYGQHDAISWLERGLDDDTPLAPIAKAVQSRAWAWCLSHNLATVAFGERCFGLGRSAGLDEGYRNAGGDGGPWPWYPGEQTSADHECQDCGSPLKSTDAEQGMRTCEGCAEERRESR